MLLRYLRFSFVPAIIFKVSAATERATIAAASECIPAKHSAQYKCNITGSYELHGDYFPPEIVEPIYTSSVKDCAYYCSRRALHVKTGQSEDAYYCQSFAFDPHLDSCQLFGPNISSILGQQDNYLPSRVYYDLGCFNCGNQFCGSTQPYGVQLLDNGDFENKYSLGLWAAANVAIVPQKGNTYVELRGPTVPNPADGISLYQYFNVCPGQYYEVYFDYIYYSTSKNGSFTSPLITNYFSWGIGIGHPSSKNGTRGQGRYYYRPNHLFFEGGHNVQYDAQQQSSNWFLALDNVVVVRRPTPTFNPRAGSTSLLTNGDFESGRLAPWSFTFSSNSRMNITSPGLSGSNYAMEISFAYLDKFFLTCGKFATKPKTMYVLSLESAKVQPTTNRTFVFDMTFYVVSNSAVTSHTFSSTTAGSTKKFRWPLWVIGKTAQVFINMNWRTGSPGAQYYYILVDNIKFQEMEDQS